MSLKFTSFPIHISCSITSALFMTCKAQLSRHRKLQEKRTNGSIASKTKVLALKHESRILRHIIKVSTALSFFPVHCSNTDKQDV